MHWTTSRRWRPALAAGGATGALALALTAAPAQAITLGDVVLAGIPPNSSSVNYTVPAAPGVVLNVAETSTATLQGSTFFDFEGLWIGSDNTGGRYTLSFNQPVSSLSLSFIALTAFGDGQRETLGSFVSNAATTSSFVSADSSATWSAGVLTPLEEDSRGRLTFNAVLGSGFTSLRFDHVQTTALQGFVIEQVDYTLAAIPELSTVAGMGVGLFVLGAAVQLRRAGSRRAAA